MADDCTDLDEIARNTFEQADIRQRGLRQLLDWQRDKKDHQIALPNRMGSSDSYLMSVSLGWIAANVSFARDLPIFKDHRLPDGDRISINDTTIMNLQQREPDYRRQLPMALYLATREHHKFPPLFLVAYQNWVYEPEADDWGPDGRALRPSLKVSPLDSKSSLVDLDVTSTKYFALDGQHRLMAIKGLKEILDGRLYAKKRDGSPIMNKSMSRDDVDNHRVVSGAISGHDMAPLHDAMDEMMGVEILPAVQRNDTFKEAVSRLRNIFVDVNENASRLEKGEIILLDENDGFRIAARTLMVRHRLFQSDTVLRVDTKRDHLPDTSEHYTTLKTIVSIAEKYLQDEFGEWSKPILDLKDAGVKRPPDNHIERGLQILDGYFTALMALPSHSRMVEGSPVSGFRKPDGEDNILFRPVAQVALAHALAVLQNDRGEDLAKMIVVLGGREEAGDLRLANKKAPWFGILCDPIDGTMRRQSRYQDLCSRMFVHLLGGGLQEKQEQESLRSRFFQARQGSTNSDKEVAYDLSGTLVSFDQFALPTPWR